MSQILDIIFVFVNTIVSGIGVIANVFIVAVNLLDWAKGRSLNTCDRILVALGMSTACFQCAVIADLHVPEALKENVLLAVLHHLILWTGYSSYWLTACLCVFYCVKIVDFNHRLFIWLKLSISKIVHWLILGSVVGPMVLGIPVYWESYQDFSQNSTTNHTAPGMITDGTQKWIWLYWIICHIFGFCVPLVSAIISITLILTSLRRHTRRMKETPSGFSQPRLEAHFGAARIMMSLLVIYIFLVIAECGDHILNYDIVNVIYLLILVFAIPLQSAILILGNTKLRKGLWKVLFPWRQ